MDPKPKPRPIALEAHILAYLGDFMNVYEESVKRLAILTIQSTTSEKPVAQ